MVIGAAYVVHRTLGFGFLEAVYRRALVIELRHMGPAVAEESPYSVPYRDESAGRFRADVVVEGCVIVEVKAGKLPDPDAPAQTLNYLRATSIDVGPIAHFGPRLSIKRRVYSGTGEESVDILPVR
jgi:GxxExxY protein